ncbi:MAG: PKD domain-containing protein [Bacteroidetes bacterium]|nr:MAG: PKD domain-containing protein [Bacteroidota bacterium]
MGSTTAVFWNFDYENNRFAYTLSASWNYMKDTVYTVSMVAVNGTCRDTITKKDFFNVLPPFPRITSVVNTCNGTRGEVTFTHETIKGISGTWDFGNGNTAPFNPAQKDIKHTYTATGQYNVSLTVTNGSCTISDSKPVFVLLKQKPLLNTDRADACANESFGFSLTNIETNPYPTNSFDRYYFKRWEYGNGSEFNGSYQKQWNFQWVNNVNGTAVSRDNKSNNIRIIFTSAFFNCDDTSSYTPLTFKGANAGYEIVTDKRCWQLPVVFRDTSKAFGTSAITSRLWNFGDGKTLSTTAGGLVSHQYANPGTYRVSLEITDAGGCRISTTSSTDVVVSGPKAAFSMSGYQVPLNETIYFYNNTNTTNSNNTQYQWSFGDGTGSTDFYPNHTYPVAGTYRIRLIASNPQTGCADTAYQTLLVRPFNTRFQMQQRFVESGGCPPVLVNFNNTSFGGVRYEWDFGDGTGSEASSASKVYRLPGKYMVKLKVYGFNGLEGEYFDSVLIGVPQASFMADPLFGCTSQGIQFKGTGKDVRNYLWDYGDGTTTTISANQTFHSYATPGVYQPRLLAIDSNGCTIPVNTPDKIVIDSLFIRFNGLPKSICDSATINLVPEVISVGGNVDAASYVYQWRITHSGQTTTINTRNAIFTFNKPGKYLLTYNVKSPFGCDKTITDSIFVVQGVKAIITAPDNACIATMVTLAGSTSQPVAGTSWKWNFGNGSTSLLQTPPAQLYNQVGNYNISLITGIGNCFDTAQHTLIIHPNPILTISNRTPISCLGSGVQLIVSGAATYQWTPAAGLSNTTIANPLANPLNNTLYRLQAKSAQGCISNDSVEVRVAKPFTITASPTNAEICIGTLVNLTATGASQYQWINNTVGLSNAAIANPTATPAASVVYTVVGRDNVNCFADTAKISIVVNPLPTINAGPDQQVTAGSTVTLQTNASANVVSYAWSPTTFLSCANCPQPTVKPLYPVTYTVKALSDKGCVALDTIKVTLECGKSFYLPSGFTPNGDGLNDRFYVLGGGGTVKSFRIFNRWGKVMFERREVAVNDSNNGWDGRFEGEPQPTGSYAYHAVLTCFDGSLFEYKGTITLVR